MYSASLEEPLTETQAEPVMEADEALVQKVQAGDSSALTLLIQRHAKRFYRVAYRLLKNRDDAEDMVQNCFLKFWQQPKGFDVRRQCKFTTWFFRVVSNQCLDLLKKKKTRALPPENLLLDEKNSSEEALERLRRQKVLEAYLEELPERQRLALNLCFYEEMNNRQAAEVMGIRLKALQSLLMRAKQTLREKVKNLDRGEAS